MEKKKSYGRSAEKMMKGLVKRQQELNTGRGSGGNGDMMCTRK
jgi:hypothetical protein